MVRDIDEKVMAFVEQTLAKNPSIAVAELFEKAKEVSDSIRGLSLTQFHARYPLQVKRRKAQAKRGSSRRKREPAARPPRQEARKPPKERKKEKEVVATSPREELRQIFLRFAVELAEAEDTADLVKVLVAVDRYVDEVMAVKNRQ